MLEIILENPLSLLELTFAELLLFALLELDGFCVLEADKRKGQSPLRDNVQRYYGRGVWKVI